MSHRLRSSLVFCLLCTIVGVSQASDVHKVFGKWVELENKKSKMVISPTDRADEGHGIVKLIHNHHVGAATYEVYYARVDDNTDGSHIYAFKVHLKDDGENMDEIWMLANDTTLMVEYKNTFTAWVKYGN